MIKIDKQKIAERQRLLTELREAYERIDAGVQTINEEIEHAEDEINDNVREFNQAREQFQVLHDELAADWRRQFDDLSTEQQESEDGIELDEVIREWEQLEIDRAGKISITSAEAEVEEDTLGEAEDLDVPE